MEVAVIGIIVIIIIVIAIWRIFRNKSQNDDDVDSYIQSNADLSSITEQGNDRWFTLAELKQAEEGKYSWDETGCVFEINSDGSVTVVGSFNPAELLVDPVQGMVDRLNEDGLLEMLPRIWSFHALNSANEVDTFFIAWNDAILSVDSHLRSINEIIDTTIISNPTDEHTDITYILAKTGYGNLTLMPSNENEYILSLGAMACLLRNFGNKVKVKISSPAVMGAFGIAINRDRLKSSRISFAYGDCIDYICCNLLSDNGICMVHSLLRSSIIQPIESSQALQNIVRGCITQTLIREGYVRDLVLIDMLPYSMSFLLKENDRVVKIYDSINEPISIPALQTTNEINVDPNKRLTFLIGANELIEDVITESHSPNGKIKATIGVDSNMDVKLNISSNHDEYEINVGELIG